MNWKKLRSEYETKTKDESEAKSTKDTKDAEGVDDKDEDDDDEDEREKDQDSVEQDATAADDNDKNVNDKEGGGHLLERAKQFDVRTDLMDQGWYISFSDIRKGSFLPRKVQQEGDVEWEENRKNSSSDNRGGGRKENGVWAHMTAKSARFLHWVGFDPTKGLPPPNEETTNALAFLGYDFMGRIVEKVN
jgi:hypothetical protein